MAIPLIILFSPILVPVGFSLFLLAYGILLAGVCCVVAIATLSWIFKDPDPSLSHHIDYASDKETMVKDDGHLMQDMVEDDTQDS